MTRTCAYVTALDRECGRTATWEFSASRVGERTALTEDHCDFHNTLSALAAAFGCTIWGFSSTPIGASA